MDNRIPKIIKDYQKSNTKNSEINNLSFNDWLIQNNDFQDDWVIICQTKKLEFEDYFTISCLIQADDDSLKNFLSDSHWFINTEFGIPEKYLEANEEIDYNQIIKAELNGVLYYPFTFRRHFNNYIQDKFQVIEHFLLYYNCFWVQKEMVYKAFYRNGELKTIVKCLINENEETYLIDAHVLKDYLSVRKVYLARFHDHRKRSKVDITDFLNSNFQTYELKNDNSFFDLDIRTDIQYDKIKSMSRLLGKDIIKPYENPESYSWSLQNEENEYLDFIIGRNENGKEIKQSCDPDGLSSYFVDKGTTHFLTPIYFKRELLQKYYAEPRKYNISEHSIEYLNFWRIEIDITKEKLVQVYLGDIGRNLPFSEQLHWRQFNVTPKGKISNHRYKRDFLVEFASPEIEEAPITYFKQEYKELNAQFKLLHGSYLFKELAKDDYHLFSTLHIPVTNEWKELDEQILGLAKISTDSFNLKILSSIIGKKIGDKGKNGKSIKGSLALFYEYLSSLTNVEELEVIITPFNMLQAFRSSSVAHRKSKALEKTLKRYNLEGLSNEKKFETILMELINSFKVIKERLE
ncbi:hypothetical protein [Luteirhabdus pelagi]|uniref:hypothetical protein n=1 Tax=Luteirhabdus pelagi TaxID=2792783 RepID=UPI00193ACB58|nr:hypothetical protein [Luteirhabdus pelagi]